MRQAISASTLSVPPELPTLETSLIHLPKTAFLFMDNDDYPWNRTENAGAQQEWAR